MANLLTRLGQLNAWLLPALKGYATSGIAGALAAVYIIATGGSAEFAAVFVPLATSLGEWIERKISALLAARRIKQDLANGTAPGSAVDPAATAVAGGGSVPTYTLTIKRYCSHNGLWHNATFSVHTVGMAKAGGWAKCETLDGRLYDLDQDAFV